jgi:hypothetical protein
MDGRVLQEILGGAVPMQPAPAQPDRWSSPSSGDGEELSEEEIQILTDRLRSLGYVG